MKKTKIILSMFVLLILSIQVIKAQTNVSGGIYANTTWTTANSPYIVVDTVVVFPGVTLTIQPGVTVKFNDNKRLEIRQAKLIAEGTITDSITFTSNSSYPNASSWSNIYLNYSIDTNKFNYCNIFYSSLGITSYLNDRFLKIKNSKFMFNAEGCDLDYGDIDSCIFINNSYGIATVYGINEFKNSLFKNCGTGILTSPMNGKIFNCKFISNQRGVEATANTTITDCLADSNSIAGIFLGSYNYDTILRCIVTNNTIGLDLDGTSTSASENYISLNTIENNNIGIKNSNALSNIHCNKICNNMTYDFYNNVAFGSNVNISSNYWCTNDSSVISIKIYDGYDYVSLSLVNFMPIDTSQCYLITEIKEKEENYDPFSIFPNPAFDKLTLVLSKNNLQTYVNIYNLIGQLDFNSKIDNMNTELDILKLKNGIYIIELTIDDKIIRKKFIKQ